MVTTRSLVDILFICLVVVAVILTVSAVYRLLNTETSDKMSDTESLQAQDAQPPETDMQKRSIELQATAETSEGPRYDAIVIPISWGAVIGTLVWRGRIRSQWRKKGYDYDVFRLVARMRGSPTRVKLMNLMLSGQKNKLQLAKELGVDWKTVDNHMDMLLAAGLVHESETIGSAKYYAVTENGKKVLSLLDENGAEQK